jgi:hypothetical protein
VKNLYEKKLKTILNCDYLSIYIKKTSMFVCLSSMHSKTTYPIVMKFCIVVVCTLRKVYV